jgi:hypothetical protein
LRDGNAIEARAGVFASLFSPATSLIRLPHSLSRPSFGKRLLTAAAIFA